MTRATTRIERGEEKAEQITKRAKAYLKMAQTVLKQEFDKVDGHLFPFV